MKKLIYFIFLSAIGSSFLTPHIAYHEVVTCAPAKYYFRATITSVKDGNWSDPATWGGIVPMSADKVTINHKVALNITTTVAGVQNKGEISFSASSWLQSSGNIINTGKIIIDQPNPIIKPGIRFLNVDESKFVGGGMDPLDSDVGLWTMDAGQLIIKGAKKTSWTNLTTGANVGATSIQVKEAAGWLAGDEITIVPTADGDITGFDDRVIQSINGTTIILDKPLTKSHPMVNGMWTAEVMNLTRNINIEGTAGHRAHIFIRSTIPSIIEYTGIRYMGPRAQLKGGGPLEGVGGRYGLHWHMCGNGSAGSYATGCVLRDIGNKAYVPHHSDEITIKDCIAYRAIDAAYWWDKGIGTNQTNKTKFHHNIAAAISYVDGAIVLNSDGSDEGPSKGAMGFIIGGGDLNEYKGNVAVGIQSSDPHLDNTGAFNWEGNNETTMAHFVHNLAHNCTTADRNWQNSNKEHLIDTFTIYNCSLALYHGAYANNYKLTNLHVYNSPIEVRAGANTDSRLEIANSVLDGAGKVNNGIEFLGSALPGGERIRVRNVKFQNFKQNNILNSAGGGEDDLAHPVDIIQSGATGFKVSGAATMYVQPESGAGNPYSVDKTGVQKTIPKFAPGVWGNGRGLRLEFFNSLNFTNPTNDYIIDPTINHNEWGEYSWYSLLSTRYSARWTGYMMAQYTEEYTFSWDGDGKGELWISNIFIEKGKKVTMEAGRQYPIRFQYISNAGRAQSVDFRWQSPSTPKEYVPYCQFSIEPQAPLPIRDPPIAYVPPAVIRTINVYPVPNHGLFFIEVPKGNFQYRITNALGQVLESGQLQGNSKKVVDITRARAGVYFLEIIGDKTDPFYKKVIKY